MIVLKKSHMKDHLNYNINEDILSILLNMNNFLSLIIFLLATTLCAEAQNSYRIGDKLQVQLIKYNSLASQTVTFA